MVIEKFLSVVKAHSRQSFHSIALAKKSKKKYYIKTFLSTRAIDQDIRPYNGHLIDLKLAGNFEFHKVHGQCAKGQKTAVKKKDRKDQAMYSKGPGWNFPVHY